MEKLFNKLEAEQSSILICNEDSNLILMDLLIDFGFFIDMLGKDYYLFKSFAIYESMRNMSIHSCCGQEILLHSRMILVLVKNFLELGSVKMIEVPNFQEVSNIIENNNISHQKLKKFAYFSNFMQKPYIKKNILCNREGVYKLVCSQILKINNFCKNVKCVYRRGIEIEEDCANLMQAVKVAPYLCCENNLINLIAGSGILNCL